MKKTLDKAVKEIGQYREEIEKKLLEFARTDLLFFWGEKRDLYLKQKTEWQPIINWVEDALKVAFERMNDKELACYYAAALNMKSVLLALALIKGKINAETAGKLSYLEELWQNEMWGNDEEASRRRKERCDELVEIESYLKK